VGFGVGLGLVKRHNEEKILLKESLHRPMNGLRVKDSPDRRKGKMQIGNLTHVAPSTSQLHPAVTLNSSRASAATTALPELATPGASTASSSAPNPAPSSAPPPRTAGSGHAHIHQIPQQSVSAAAAVSEVTSVSAYATTIAGQQYAGSVEESGGEYTASIPSVALATSSGSTAAAAETNLDIRIDELV
jgi:hypothetical protein